MPYTETWDETKPAGGRNVNLGDNDIREFKSAVRERLATDHHFVADETGKTNIGLHKKVSFYTPLASDPTAETSVFHLYSKDVSDKAELFGTDEDDNNIQLTSGGGIMAESISGVYAAANTAAIATIMSLIYPIGYVITLGVSTNPGTLLGIGTWTAITGTVIVGKAAAGTFNTLDATGGAESVNLSHTHATTIIAGGTEEATAGNGILADKGQHEHSTDSKLSATQSLLQPYIVKYVWQRTA